MQQVSAASWHTMFLHTCWEGFSRSQRLAEVSEVWFVQSFVQRRVLQPGYGAVLQRFCTLELLLTRSANQCYGRKTPEPSAQGAHVQATGK